METADTLRIIEEAMIKIIHSHRVNSDLPLKDFIQLVREAKTMGAPHVSEIYSPPG